MKEQTQKVYPGSYKLLSTMTFLLRTTKELRAMQKFDNVPEYIAPKYTPPPVASSAVKKAKASSGRGRGASEASATPDGDDDDEVVSHASPAPSSTLANSKKKSTVPKSSKLAASVKNENSDSEDDGSGDETENVVATIENLSDDHVQNLLAKFRKGNGSNDNPIDGDKYAEEVKVEETVNKDSLSLGDSGKVSDEDLTTPVKSKKPTALQGSPHAPASFAAISLEAARNDPNNVCKEENHEDEDFTRKSPTWTSVNPPYTGPSGLLENPYPLPSSLNRGASVISNASTEIAPLEDVLAATRCSRRPGKALTGIQFDYDGLPPYSPSLEVAESQAAKSDLWHSEHELSEQTDNAEKKINDKGAPPVLGADVIEISSQMTEESNAHDQQADKKRTKLPNTPIQSLSRKTEGHTTADPETKRLSFSPAPDTDSAAKVAKASSGKTTGKDKETAKQETRPKSVTKTSKLAEKPKPATTTPTKKTAEKRKAAAETAKPAKKRKTSGETKAESVPPSPSRDKAEKEMKAAQEMLRAAEERNKELKIKYEVALQNQEELNKVSRHTVA